VSVILYYRVQDNFCRPISQYIVCLFCMCYLADLAITRNIQVHIGLYNDRISLKEELLPG